MSANLYEQGQERYRSFEPPVMDALPLDDAPLSGTKADKPAPRCVLQADKPLPQARPRQNSRPAESDRPPAAARRGAQAQEKSRPHQRLHQTHSAARRRPLSRFVEPEENPNFYLSLSDLMCLLLVFFVLIFSLNDGAKSEPTPTPPPAQVSAAAPARQVVKAAMPLPTLRSLEDPFPNPEPASPKVRAGMANATAAGQSDPGLVPEMAAARLDSSNFDRALFTLVASAAPVPASALPAEDITLDEILGHAPAQAGGLEMEKADGRVILRLPEAITFDLAKAEIKPGMREALARLAGILARHPEVPVTVTGHTDDLPISTPAFASNWELSSARASAVARALAAQGLDQSRLTIKGLADRQPRVPNDSETHRGQNRRVEIELRLNG